MGSSPKNAATTSRNFPQETVFSALLVGVCLTSCANELGDVNHRSDDLGHPGDPSASTGGAENPAGGGGATGSNSSVASGSAPGATGGASGSGGSVPTPGGGGAPSETNSKCKRGIPFDRWADPQPSLADLDAINPQAFWFYNWTASPNPDLDYTSRGFEFVPMVWNGEFNTQEIIDQIPEGAKYLLGFNEPMISGQGGVNMTLEQVLNRWPEVEKIAAARGLTLLSPALTFSNIPGRQDGPVFLEDFIDACPDCRIDAIAVHTYTCEAEWVRDHIEPYRKFGLPIWVTEFACMDGDKERVKRFMRETVDFFEKDPIIERYAWFMSRAGDVSLLSNSGQLTELGQIYVDQPYNENCVR